MTRKRFHRILSIPFLLLSIAITSATVGARDSAIPERDGASSLSVRVKHRKPADVEIRLAFTSITPDFDDSYAPIFMVIGQDGRAHALRYQLRYQSKAIASYEGVLPEAVVQQLFARVRAVFRLPRHRKDYDRRLIYESDSFYLAVKSDNGKVKEMFGSIETRPEEVRALVGEMTELWRRLSEAPPAYAYVTSHPIEKDRLRLLRSKYKVDLTPIESLPADFQSLLIPVVTQPLNFYHLTKAQYTQLKAGKLAVTYKGMGYELSLFLSEKEGEPQDQRKQDEDLTPIDK